MLDGENWEFFESDPAPGTSGIVEEVFVRGRTQYELSNHLGNVLVTISDNRIPVLAPEGIELCDDALMICYRPIDHFEAQVLTANDYYPFGMGMPGRRWTAPAGAGEGGYRYGFNGQEKSTEIDPTGNSMTAEFWQYDARLGRRWNIDPVVVGGVSSYACLDNAPIYFTDPLGLYRTKREAEKMQKRAVKAGWNVGEVQYFDKKGEWGFNEVSVELTMGKDGNPDEIKFKISRILRRTEFQKKLSDRPGEEKGSGGFFKESPFANFVEFLSNLNPIDGVELYAGGLVKTELLGREVLPSSVSGKLPKNARSVVPFGGVQYKYVASFGNDPTSNVSIITGDQTFFGAQVGNTEFRLMPLSGIGGDYKPGGRILRTIMARPIIFHIAGTPIPIGTCKIQSEVGGSLNGGGYTGLRAAAETIAIPGIIAKFFGADVPTGSGIKVEINMGVRVLLK